VERKLLVLGGDDRDGRLRRDGFKIHPLVVSAVAARAVQQRRHARLQHEGAGGRMNEAEQQHQAHRQQQQRQREQQQATQPAAQARSVRP
jgi:hypothetical protein